MPSLKALETRMVELEELRKIEKYIHETFSDTAERSHPWYDSICTVE